MLGVAVSGVARVVLVNKDGRFYTEDGLTWTSDIKEAKIFLGQSGLGKIGEIQRRLNAGGPLLHKVHNEAKYLRKGRR